MTWVPNWYALALLSLASWRTYQLFVRDEIFDRPRRWVTRLNPEWEKEGDPISLDYRYAVAAFMNCPYCFGFWISLSWYIAWLIADTGALVLAVPLAISTALLGLEEVLGPEE